MAIRIGKQLMTLVVRNFDQNTWARMAAALIQDQVNLNISSQSPCSVMLTGGRSAFLLYKTWTESRKFHDMKGVRFYFGDERCVPADHPDSNYGMVRRSLFGRGVPAGCSVFPMNGADSDRDAAARHYDKALPEKIDVLLLGVGDDGHIASLFPGSSALLETERRVVPVVGPTFPCERLTITPPVIKQARSIFVLGTGTAKAAVLRDLLAVRSDDVLTLPARLVLDATWLLNTALPESPLTGY